MPRAAEDRYRDFHQTMARLGRDHRFSMIAPDRVPFVWKRAAELLQPAFDQWHDDDLDHWHVQVVEGFASLWMASTSALITDEDGPPDATYVRIKYAGGEMQQLLECLAGIEAYARTLDGVRGVEIWGREPWARVLRESYTVRAVILRRDFA